MSSASCFVSAQMHCADRYLCMISEQGFAASTHLAGRMPCSLCCSASASHATLCPHSKAYVAWARHATLSQHNTSLSYIAWHHEHSGLWYKDMTACKQERQPSTSKYGLPH